MTAQLLSGVVLPLHDMPVLAACAPSSITQHAWPLPLPQSKLKNKSAKQVGGSAACRSCTSARLRLDQVHCSNALHLCHAFYLLTARHPKPALHRRATQREDMPLFTASYSTGLQCNCLPIPP